VDVTHCLGHRRQYTKVVCYMTFNIEFGKRPNSAAAQGQLPAPERPARYYKHGIHDSERNSPAKSKLPRCHISILPFPKL
jgi:hypothetical protein